MARMGFLAVAWLCKNVAHPAINGPFSDDFTIFTPSLDLGMSDLSKQPEDLDLWVAV